VSSRAEVRGSEHRLLGLACARGRQIRHPLGLAVDLDFDLPCPGLLRCVDGQGAAGERRGPDRAGAQATIMNAGIEPAYADIKTLTAPAATF